MSALTPVLPEMKKINQCEAYISCYVKEYYLLYYFSAISIYV